MSLQELTEFTPDAVAAQTEGCSLVLLAPRYRKRNALMGWFLDSGTDTFFHALSKDDTTLRDFLAGLVEGFRDFDPKFGDQTRHALAEQDTGPEDLADALLADLGKAKPKPRYLIIDNFDYLAPDKDSHNFFRRVVKGLPRTLKLVINSRYLSHEPWASMVRAGSACVLGDSQTIDGGIFSTEKPPSPHLEVYGLAGGSVFVNGLPLTTWDGPLPRNLFYYFVDHPMVTRDEIFETFWPDLPTKEATNVFHVTKRKISERLGYELTAYSSGFYRPSGQMMVHYDAARFEAAVKEGRDLQSSESPEIWYRAIRLYRAPFLHGIEMPWIIRRREDLKLAFAEALIGVGRLYKGLNETELAISYYLRALREVPQREDIHRDVMTLYGAQNEVHKAVAQYRLLSDILKRTLNITPSKATRTLYNLLTGGAEN